MNSQYVLKGCLIAAVVTVGTQFNWDRRVAAQQTSAGAVKGVEVLTRGPVHEAFAETVTFDPQPGIVVPKAPPDAIEELPPDQKPEGENVAWIPGYWAWDDEREDFLWVSGIWRALPPGRQWVPGYWGQSGREFQWTSGYWADAKESENVYLPEPPASVEAGPNVAAPSADQIWIPGSWVWNENRYAWQPGYWSAAQENWVWVPSHYLWSPRGYVFVNGYYDYSVARRGVLFAPVYFAPGIYAQQGFTYSPAIVISTAVFGNQLFLRPNYNHYYFGDYYGPSYASMGFSPWFSFNSGGYGYDPFYAQQRWQNRQNSAWEKSVQTTYQDRVDHEAARPPRTLVAQQAVLKTGDASLEKNLVAATSLEEVASSKDTALRFQPVTKDEQQALAKHGQEVRQFGVERQKRESKTAKTSSEKPTTESEPARVKLPKSPILARSPDQLGKDHAPPKSHEAPPSDPKVEPKPRAPVVKGESPRSRPNVTGRQPTSKPMPKAEPKPAPKAERKPDPKAEPKPTPRAEPKAAPKAEPKPAPRVEPKPAPKAAPKPAPRAEPKAAPKVEPKPGQKAEPKPVPKAEPKPGRSNAEPKGGKEKEQPRS